MTAKQRASEFPLTPADRASGRRKEAEPTDPFVATAVSLATPGYDGLAAMARTFIQEFALMGWSRPHITRMFRTPALAGPHAVYRARGAEFVESLITEVLGPEHPLTPEEEG